MHKNFSKKYPSVIGLVPTQQMFFSFLFILGPMFVGFVVTNAVRANSLQTIWRNVTKFFFILQEDPMLWRICFFVAAGVFFFGNLIFVIFGKGSIQPWNNIHKANASNNPDKMSKFLYRVNISCLHDQVERHNNSTQTKH